MKKLLAVLFTFALVFSMTMPVFAQDSSATPAQTTEKTKKAKKAKKAKAPKSASTAAPTQ